MLFWIFFPFLCTSLGAAMVFLFKEKITNVTMSAFYSIAGGVMVSASFFSLILPAFSRIEDHPISAVFIGVSFFIGGLFLFVVDFILRKVRSQQKSLLYLAITLHNIPEGMSVGLLYGLYMKSQDPIYLSGAIALSIGIGIQNIPEGAAISLPLKAQGISKRKAFWMGVSSGMVEPIAALTAAVLISMVEGWMPFLLSFSAGCMIYVVVEELVPQARAIKECYYTSIIFMIGFIIMMVLDVILG